MCCERQACVSSEGWMSPKRGCGWMHPVAWAPWTPLPLGLLFRTPSEASCVYLPCFSLLISGPPCPPSTPCSIFWPLLVLVPGPETISTHSLFWLTSVILQTSSNITSSTKLSLSPMAVRLVWVCCSNKDLSSLKKSSSVFVCVCG